MELNVSKLNDVDNDLYISYYIFYTRICGQNSFSNKNFDALVNNKRISKISEYFDPNIASTTSAVIKIKNNDVKFLTFNDGKETVAYSRFTISVASDEIIIGDIALNYKTVYSDELYNNIVNSLIKYLKDNYPQIDNITFIKNDNDLFLNNTLEKNGYQLNNDGNYIKNVLISQNDDGIQCL